MATTHSGLPNPSPKVLALDPAKFAALVTTLCDKQESTPFITHLLQLILHVAHEADMKWMCLDDLDNRLAQMEVLHQKNQKVRVENEELKAQVARYQDIVKDFNNGSEDEGQVGREEAKVTNKHRKTESVGSVESWGEASEMLDSKAEEVKRGAG